MGYDMHCRNNAERDDNYYESNNYFRANIWGMGKLREVMDEHGILDWNEDHPPFPEAEEDDEDEDGEWDEEAWDKRTEHVRSHRSPNPEKVPGFKFCSNDGWIVTPEECIVIADKLCPNKSGDEEICSEVMEEDCFAQDFGKFCRYAADNGGFNVW